MSVTASSLGTTALQKLGVLASGETLSAADGAIVLDRLNAWLDSLGVERLTMHYTLRTSHTLGAGTASYTLGSGGTINIQRPTFLERAGLIQDTSATDPQEVPIRVLTDQDYAEWPFKTLQETFPSAVWYDHNWSAGLGRVYPLPIPSAAGTALVLYTPQQATAFADLTTSYTLPPAYQRFYTLGLARELPPDYGVTFPRDLEDQYTEVRATLKIANLRPVALKVDPALRPRATIINTISGNEVIL